MKIWSILLGHNGVVDDSFYEKYTSVLNVRKKIRNELYISILSFIGFISIYLIAIRSNNDFISVLQYPMYIFMGLSILSFFAHLKVIFEWRNHDLKMLEDFYGTIDNDDN
jgi:predicted neutral ceramidase superfamily lipid hydrolase